MLDAMVFFSIAMLVSSAILTGVETSVSCDPGLTGPVGRDPGQVLGVFLKSSLGAEVSLDLGEVVTLSGRDEVASCLAAELAALAGGWDQDLFAPLNDALLEILSDIAGVGYCAVLSAYSTSDASSLPVLVIGGATSLSANGYSASCTVPGVAGCAHLVVLVLCPTPLPELRHV